MSTDSYVISPIIFPGGDIGSLAVHGTINDVSMSGAKPLYLSAGFIIEEGLDLKILEQIVLSMAEASKDAGVPIITGDTKVVERGKGDGLYINTTGIGKIPHNLNISGSNAKPGDKVIVNGSIGDHGMAILSFRENLQFETTLTVSLLLDRDGNLIEEDSEELLTHSETILDDAMEEESVADVEAIVDDAVEEGECLGQQE